MNSVDYRPSTIATAAIFAASGKELTKQLLESEMGIISVDIVSCFFPQNFQFYKFIAYSMHHFSRNM